MDEDGGAWTAQRTQPCVLPGTRARDARRRCRRMVPLSARERKRREEKHVRRTRGNQRRSVGQGIPTQNARTHLRGRPSQRTPSRRRTRTLAKGSKTHAEERSAGRDVGARSSLPGVPPAPGRRTSHVVEDGHRIRGRTARAVRRQTNRGGDSVDGVLAEEAREEQQKQREGQEDDGRRQGRITWRTTDQGTVGG